MFKSQTLSIAHWRAAIQGAANEIATYALSLRCAIVKDPIGADRASKLIGAHIPLLGGGQAHDLALVSSADGCAALARSMLGVATGAPLRDQEVADAVRELVNMLGGAMKRRLSVQIADLALGLPIFLHGHPQRSDRQSIIALPARFGEVDTIVLVTGPSD
jgi:hypothetical protein